MPNTPSEALQKKLIVEFRKKLSRLQVLKISIEEADVSLTVGEAYSILCAIRNSIPSIKEGDALAKVVEGQWSFVTGMVKLCKRHGKSFSPEIPEELPFGSLPKADIERYDGDSLLQPLSAPVAKGAFFVAQYGANMVEAKKPALEPSPATPDLSSAVATSLKQ